MKSELLGWIGGSAGAAERFDALAMEVFRFQFSNNPVYRRYCEAKGRPVERVGSWREIPALPTDAFKFPRLPVRSFDAEGTGRYFLTSGTTTEVRGRHEFEDLELYEASILGGWREAGLPEVKNPWFFSQGPASAETSSLVWMFEVLRKEAKADESRWMIDGEGRVAGSVDAGGGPMEIFSTAVGLLRWMEKGAPVRLPEGSWIFETGGYKGLSETMEPEVFREKVAGFFGVPESRILNEYSMTELSSQFYRWGGGTVHHGPFWTRIRVVDPETGREAGRGEAGYLEIVDLANLGSVAALRTQDLAVAAGDSGFVLLGRDPGALPRGCSRAADELLSRR